MSSAARFDHVDLIARDYDTTIAFYRKLGLVVHGGQAGEMRHAHIDLDGVAIHIDDEHVARLSNASWWSGDQPRVVVNFRVPTREGVDARYAELTGAGYAGVQEPHDAFWGARYAVVADPDGNHVGLTSSIDIERRSPSPPAAPAGRAFGAAPC